MNKYNSLELMILSCLLQKPQLMENNKLEDKYFVKHKKIWLFMKTFYNKYKNFDIELMVTVSNDKYKAINYIVWLIEQETTPSHFDCYVDTLIEEYNELKKDKYIREKVYELANNLYDKKISTGDFIKKCEEIYKDAEIIYQND